MATVGKFNALVSQDSRQTCQQREFKSVNAIYTTISKHDEKRVSASEPARAYSHGCCTCRKPNKLKTSHRPGFHFL